MLDVDDTYRRWFPIIRAKCARMTRSDALAQDLAQETFTRLWSSRQALVRPEAVLPWIYRTATHASLDWSLANESLAETYMAGWTFTW